MAASVEALAALTRSVDAWNHFRLLTTGPIDLTLASLQGKDLRGRSFAFCDLSGSELDEANLDRCSFDTTTLKNASLRNASMVSCKFSGVNASDAILDYSIIRESTLLNSNFSHAKLRHANISLCTFEGCTFDQTKMDGVRFVDTNFYGGILHKLQDTNVEFNRCKLLRIRMTDIRWHASSLIDCDLSDSSISDLEFSNGVITNTKMARADILRLATPDTEVLYIDFSYSTLRETDLAGIDLPHSTMLGMVISQCHWPRQKATIDWLGRYHKSPNLLAQPVQDLHGLSSTLRREVADAQYLNDLYRKADNLLVKYALWMWGATTAYGQSILRLSIVTLLLILVLSGIFIVPDLLVVPDFSINTVLRNLTTIPKTFALVSSAFLGIIDESTLAAYSNLFQHILLIVARISGFVVIGLWISIAAVKLSRLSAE